jgi:hypothetical protein
MQEEYLVHLEAAFGEFEEQEARRLPKRHYYVLGTENDDSWGEVIGFNDRVHIR